MSQHKMKRSAKTKNMDPGSKKVQGPLDPEPRVRGNKAGRGRIYLPSNHPSNTAARQGQ